MHNSPLPRLPFLVILVLSFNSGCFKTAPADNESATSKHNDSASTTSRGGEGESHATSPPDTNRDTAEPRIPDTHRPDAVICDSLRDVPEPVNTTEWDACTAHADCATGENGRCSASREGYNCTYDACFSDEECPEGGVCECGDAAANHCLTEGNCRVDADCGVGGFCSPTLGDCGNYAGVIAYYCHTPEDACLDDSDCADLGTMDPYCAYNPVAGRWMCSDSHCVG